MPRLLQINTVVNSGSVGRIAEDTGKWVQQNGWESYIAYGRNERESSSRLIRIGSDWEVKLHGVKTRFFDAHGFGSKQATIRFIRQLQRIRPDIIHLHNLHGYYLNIEVLFAYLSQCNIPVVWTLHDCWSFTGHCVHFQDIGCQKWQTQCNNCRLQTNYPASLFLDRSPKNYIAKKNLFTSVPNMTIVPVCYWLEDIVKKSFLKKVKTKVIHNGIDTEVFVPRNTSEVCKKYGLENKFVLIAIANVWNSTKGFQDILQISKYLSYDDRILMIGVNKHQKQKLPPNVIGIERTENIHELAELYSVADVLINPTYQDTFPTINLEAQACGLPVITYATGGCAEAVNDETGIVVKTGDVEEFVNAIAVVKQKGKVAYSSFCRENIWNHYRKENKYDAYFSLYKHVLESTK